MQNNSNYALGIEHIRLGAQQNNLDSMRIGIENLQKAARQGNQLAQKRLRQLKIAVNFANADAMAYCSNAADLTFKDWELQRLSQAVI